METVHVVNIKCGGCVNSIKKGLEEIGAKNITVDIANQTVSFKGDKKAVVQKLSKMGYPEVGTDEANSILKKAKSFMSCGIGKLN